MKKPEPPEYSDRIASACDVVIGSMFGSIGKYEIKRVSVDRKDPTRAVVDIVMWPSIEQLCWTFDDWFGESMALWEDDGGVVAS